jgi:hypothetical protein
LTRLSLPGEPVTQVTVYPLLVWQVGEHWVSADAVPVQTLGRDKTFQFIPVRFGVHRDYFRHRPNHNPAIEKLFLLDYKGKLEPSNGNDFPECHWWRIGSITRRISQERHAVWVVARRSITSHE